jgi:hypothetical protein
VVHENCCKPILTVENKERERERKREREREVLHVVAIVV